MRNEQLNSSTGPAMVLSATRLSAGKLFWLIKAAISQATVATNSIDTVKPTDMGVAPMGVSLPEVTQCWTGTRTSINGVVVNNHRRS